MRDPCTYDYAVIRVVPRVEREEFVNVGIVVSCSERDFLEARIVVDTARLLALDPGIDLAIRTLCPLSRHLPVPVRVTISNAINALLQINEGNPKSRLAFPGSRPYSHCALQQTAVCGSAPHARRGGNTWNP